MDIQDLVKLRNMLNTEVGSLLYCYISDYITKGAWVELTCNGKTKNPKRVYVQKKENTYYDEAVFDDSNFSVENPYAKTVVEISTPQTWYTLGVKIFTQTLGQGFYIYSMELKNIKVKTKTRGR